MFDGKDNTTDQKNKITEYKMTIIILNMLYLS